MLKLFAKGIACCNWSYTRRLKWTVDLVLSHFVSVDFSRFYIRRWQSGALCTLSCPQASAAFPCVLPHHLQSMLFLTSCSLRPIIPFIPPPLPFPPFSLVLSLALSATSLFTSTGDWKCCTALWCILILFVWPLGCRYSVIVGWIESNCLQIRLSSGRSYHTNAYLIDTYTLCLCRCSQTKSFGGLRSRHRNLWHRLWFPRIVQFSRFERRQLLFKS